MALSKNDELLFFLWTKTFTRFYKTINITALKGLILAKEKSPGIEIISEAASVKL